MVMF